MHLLTKRQNIDTKLIREINSTAIPLILSTVTGTVMGMIDQAFVGHISVYAYGGVGLVASCINSLIGVLGAFWQFSSPVPDGGHGPVPGFCPVFPSGPGAGLWTSWGNPHRGGKLSSDIQPDHSFESAVIYLLIGI